MSAPELRDWEAFGSLEPWGSERDDYQAALIAYTVHRSQGGKMAFNDFLLKFGPKRGQSVEEMEKVVRGLG